MPTTLLAVDDSVTMRKVLELTFAGEDFRVVTAEGADAAFAKIRSDRPAIVLCDVTLDGPGGYALCTRIKAENPAISVVMLASKQQPYDNAKGQAAKADDFVEKPFDTQQLIDKVKRLTSRPAAQDPATRPAVSQVGAPPAPSSGGAPVRPAAATAPLGGARPAAPTGAAVNPRPPAPSMGSAGGIGRGTLAFGFPGSPMTPGAPAVPAPAAPAPAAPAPASSGQGASAGPASVARPPVPSSPMFPQGAAAQAAPPAAAAAAAPPPSPAAPAPPLAPASPAAPTPAAAAAPPPLPAGPARAPAPSGPALGATAPNSALAEKLAQIGLTDVQVTAVLALSREVVERVVWEVVPVLAETMIKEEIARLTQNA